MKDRFDEGLIFRRLDDRGKMFIEYMPIETVWKPVHGRDYFFIHCLWVSWKFKWQGIAKELLEGCIEEAKQAGKHGVAVITSTKVQPFLTDKKFYEHFGFRVVDTAPPYFDLLALSFDSWGSTPTFDPHLKSGKYEEGDWLAFVYTHQCPFMEGFVQKLALIAESLNIPTHIHHLTSREEVMQYGSPFGTLGIYYNGDFLTHSLMPESQFRKWLPNAIQQSS